MGVVHILGCEDASMKRLSEKHPQALIEARQERRSPAYRPGFEPGEARGEGGRSSAIPAKTRGRHRSPFTHGALPVEDISRLRVERAAA